MLIQSKIYWAKVFEPVPGFEPDELEWSFDLAMDEKTHAQLKKSGSTLKLRDKPGIGKVVTVRKKAKLLSGEDSKPIKIVDAEGDPWDPSVLIGNGSTVVVDLWLRETEYKRKKFIKTVPTEIKVLFLVQYSRKADPLVVGEDTEIDTPSAESWEDDEET